MKGKEGHEGPILPIVSAVTCVEVDGQDPFLIVLNQACYYADQEQDESLLLPFQAMQHGIEIDLTPFGRKQTNGDLGTQKMVIDSVEIPLRFDGRKMFLNIRKPSEIELEELEVFELTSPTTFEPQEKEFSQRRDNKKKVKLPGGISMTDWRKRLAMVPEDIVRKTLDATTQLALSIETENRMGGRRHYKSRFPFLKEKRLNDQFHSDTFFPSANTNKGETCSQLFVGRDSNYMYVHPMKKESHSAEALQDFGRTVGIPHSIKTDNAKTEIGEKWKAWCRTYCVDSYYTEPHSPWQNLSENGIGDLGTMVKRCLREFDAPLSRHGWCQKWCVDVRNHVSSRKLKWRTPHEVLTGETPDISVFRFHFWESVMYWDPTIKQPEDGWLPGRFLGIAWKSGDAMTYYIETDKPKDQGRNVVLTRSTVKPRLKMKQTAYTPESGEKEPEVKSNSEVIDIAKDETKETDEDSGESLTKSSDDRFEVIFEEEKDEDDANNEEEQISMGLDDAFEDNIFIDDELEDLVNGEEEDYEFDKFIGYRWNNGRLVLKVQLDSGKTYDSDFGEVKRDRPIELARYIRNEVVESKRGGFYETWAQNALKSANRTIRRMAQYHNIDRLMRLRHVKSIKLRRQSRNTRTKNKGKRVKFGLKIPNNTREALIIDAENGNNLWADAIAKEMGALEKANCFAFYPPGFKVGSEYQYAPLRLIFDIKQEDFRRKARLVAGGHVVDASMYESYSSTVQTRTIRILETVAINENMSMVTGDIGNAFVQAETKEKIYTRAGLEFGDRQGCMVIIKKALYGLSTSARQWSKRLGDSLRGMGFKPSRCDPDLWLKLKDDGSGYEYMATYVDDIIIVADKPEKYLLPLQEQFPIRHIEMNPEYYLGNNLETRNDGTVKVSSRKYITEVISRYEKEYGELRKENVPCKPGDHPELDDSPTLDDDGRRRYQSIIGTCQWISTAGRLDICFAVSSLSRFSSNPREGHLHRAIKIFGYLKKYTKKGFIIDPRSPVTNLNFERVEPDFGNQYSDFVEEVDPSLPMPLMKELDITIFVDADHAHDKATGRSITGMVSFVGRTPIYWCSKRQSAVQTSTFGSEFTALKRAVEEAITLRYYLRAMGIKISKPAIIYGDNLSAITNTIEPGSALKKKHIALAYHFCREHYSGNVVDIRKIVTKDNYSDPLTKALLSTEFHGHINEMMEN